MSFLWVMDHICLFIQPLMDSGLFPLSAAVNLHIRLFICIPVFSSLGSRLPCAFLPPSLGKAGSLLLSCMWVQATCPYAESAEPSAPICSACGSHVASSSWPVTIQGVRRRSCPLCYALLGLRHLPWHLWEPPGSRAHGAAAAGEPAPSQALT